MKTTRSDAMPQQERDRFKTRLIVRSYEVDGFRHVNNAVFARYLEAARGAFLRAIGLGYHKLSEWDAFPAVTRLEIDYASPARADDEIEIALWVASWRRTQFTMRYELRNARTGLLLASAETRHAFMNDAGDVVRVPAEFRAAVDAAESS